MLGQPRPRRKKYKVVSHTGDVFPRRTPIFPPTFPSMRSLLLKISDNGNKDIGEWFCILDEKLSLSLFKMVALWQEQTASVKAEVALTGGGWMQISIPHLCSLSWAGGTASVTPHLGDVPVPRICHFCGIEKIWYPVISLGTGIRKIWYRNKSWNRYPSNLVPEKGLWTGIGQIWYQKKYWYWYRKYLVQKKVLEPVSEKFCTRKKVPVSVWKIFVTGKSIGIGIV